MAEYFNDIGLRNAYSTVALWNDDDDALLGSFARAFEKAVVPIVPRDAGGDHFEGVRYPSRNLIAVAGHELYHDLAARHPDLHAWFLEQAIPYMRDTERYAEIENRGRAEDEKLGPVQLAEELLADFTGDALADPEFLQQLADDNPGKFTQLLNAVKRWLNKIIARLQGNRSDELITDVKALRDHLAQALKVYAEGGRVADLPAPNLKFSRQLAVSMTGDYYSDYAKTTREFNGKPDAERQARLSEGLAEATGIADGRVQSVAGRSGRGAAGGVPGVGGGVQRATSGAAAGEYLRYSVIANGVARDFADRGATSLIGKEVRNSHDLAVAAQVYRNPKIETARYFFIKGGHVVGQAAVSSRKPGNTQLLVGNTEAERQKYLDEMVRQAKSLGAESVWLLHNHPDGNPIPSDADASATELMSGEFGRRGIPLTGHVIINQNKYGVIEFTRNFMAGGVNLHDFGEAAQYDIANPKQAHALLGVRVHSAGDLAKAAKQAQVSPGQVVIIGVSGTQGIRVISEVTPTQLRGAFGAGMLRRIARQTGSDRLFAYGVAPQDINAVRAAVKSGLLVDAIIIENGVEYSAVGLTGVRQNPGYSLGTMNRGYQVSMTAWHGSPHDHDGFSAEHIGMGEGAQAFGWGHYFAGRKEIAEYYRDTLARGVTFERNGKTFNPGWGPTSDANEIALSHAAGRLRDALKYTKNVTTKGVATEAMNAADSAEKDSRLYNDPAASHREAMIAEHLRQLAGEALDGTLTVTKGRLYQVELAPAEDEYLDWRKPISEQSEKVKAALDRLDNRITFGKDRESVAAQWKAIAGTLPLELLQMSGNEFYNYVAGKLNAQHDSPKSGPQQASEYLRSLGIRGIRYLDGNSRGSAMWNVASFDADGNNINAAVFATEVAAEAHRAKQEAKGYRVTIDAPKPGDHNYVIFDDADVEISAKFSLTEPEADYNSGHGLLDNAAGNRAFDRAELPAIRRAAARLERPRDGVFLRVTEDGEAIATGPKGARVPQTFVRFAEEHGLKFMARRARGDRGGLAQRYDRDWDRAIFSEAEPRYSEPMPISYREAGALYFDEMGKPFLDRTGMTRFSLEADEYAAVEARYRGTPEWMKAPNGEPTKLNERQWVQVRTPSFKAWFGDWELAALGRSLRPVRGSDQAEAVRDRIVGRPLTNAETGMVATVSGESWGKMASKSGVDLSISPYAHYQALGNLDKLFSMAIKREERGSRKSPDTISAIHHFDVPMPFDGEMLLVKIMAKEHRQKDQGTRLYLVQAVEIEKPASIGGSHASPSLTTSPISVPPAGFNSRIAQMIAAVKGDDVSRVVTDNGEPMVVYHGGTFDEDDKRGLLGDGWWTQSKEEAQAYADEHDGKLTAAYLSIKAPGIVGRDGSEVHDLVATARRSGKFDGVFHPRTGDWITLLPAQIKSATGNTGAFDGQNPDIRHSLPGERGSLSAAGVRASLVADFGEQGVANLENAGILKIVQRVDELPDDLRNAKAEGVYDPRFGIAYLIADNLAAGRVRPVTMHDTHLGGLRQRPAVGAVSLRCARFRRPMHATVRRERGRRPWKDQRAMFQLHHWCIFAHTGTHRFPFHANIPTSFCLFSGSYSGVPSGARWCILTPLTLPSGYRTYRLPATPRASLPSAPAPSG